MFKSEQKLVKNTKEDKNIYILLNNLIVQL